MSGAIKKTVRGIEITDDVKLRTKKFKTTVVQIFLFFLAPFWIIRFRVFLSPASRGWTNAMQRKHEKRYFVLFVIGFLGCYFFIHAWLVAITGSDSPSGYAQFFLTWILSDVVLNPFSRRWLRPDLSTFMYSGKRIPLSYAPDANGSSYPLGWSTDAGWIRHGFRTFGMRPEIFPRHLVVFGEYGYGQNEMALNCTMRAFEVLKNVVVLVLDVDAGGLNFRALKDVEGIYIADTQVECEKAIWYVAQIIKQRKKTLKPGTNFLIVADMSLATSLIGRNSETSHIASAIDEVVTEGRNFGVNVVAFPPAQYFYQRIAEDYQHYYDSVQYFTKAKYKIKQGGAGTMMEKNVESPRAGLDYFLFHVNGKAVEFKACAPTMEQVINRITETKLPEEAIKWWRDFSLGNNFKDFEPLPRRDEAEVDADSRRARWQERRRRPHIGAPKYEHIPQPNEGAADAGEKRYE